jgi:hypothetical protein
MRGGRWVPGWTETHTQALAPLDFEPLPERVPVASRWAPEDVAAGEVWPPHGWTSCSCGLVLLEDEAETWTDDRDHVCHGWEECTRPPAPPRRRWHSSDSRGMDPGLFC